MKTLSLIALVAVALSLGACAKKEQSYGGSSSYGSTSSSSHRSYK